MTSGFQLLAEVNDDIRRSLTVSEEQYGLILRVGIRSLMLVPVVSRGHIAGIVSFIYTNESGRQASESRFRVALAGARTVVYEQDRDLRYVYYYNPLTPFTAVGKTPDAVFPPDQAAVVNRKRTRVLERGESAFEESDRTAPGDRRRHSREAIEPVSDRAGKIIGLIGAATDITEQRDTQQQLREALTFRERMMGILGHDLRNPLSTIIMTDGLLLKQEGLAPDARNFVLRSLRAAERMREMIDTLLDFTRVRFLGKVPITPVAADLGQISAAVADELCVTWPDRAIEVDVRGDPHGE